MDINEYVFNEIMSVQTKTDKTLVLCLDIMSKYVKKIDFNVDEKNRVFYFVLTKEVFDKNLSKEELFNLNQHGWHLNSDKKNIILYI